MRDKHGYEIINVCSGHPTMNDCVVAGRYTQQQRTASGGDSIKYVDQMKLLAEFVIEHGYDFVYEGWPHQSKQMIEHMSKLDAVTVMYMDETIDTIYERRKQRSLDRGYDNDFKTKTGTQDPARLKKDNQSIAQLPNVELIDTHSNLVAELYQQRSVKRKIIDFKDDEIWNFRSLYDTQIGEKTKYKQRMYNHLFE